MDDQDKALNLSGEDTTPATTPVTEQKTGAEPTEPKLEGEPTGEPKVEDNVEEPSKKGANARIQELNAQKKAAEAQRDTLAKKVEELEAVSQGFDLNQFPASTIRPGDEITPEQYEAEVQRKAQAAALLVVKRQETINNLKQGIKEAISENPELRPGSEKFDPDLSESISEDVENFIKVNPRGDVKKFIEKKLKPYKKSQEQLSGEVTREIAKQATQTATRPTAHQGGEKPFDSLSLSEMEAKLGKVY